MMTSSANADPLKDEIAPPANCGWPSPSASAVARSGPPRPTPVVMRACRVDLGREMAAQLGVPVEYVVHQNSGQITDAAARRQMGCHVPAPGRGTGNPDELRPGL